VSDGELAARLGKTQKVTRGMSFMPKKSNSVLLNFALLVIILAISFQAQAPSNIPTVTYGVAQESSAGMDGGIAWQSVFLLNDGRIASFGTGNHAPEQSNAMRIIDPVTTPGSVTSYDAFPWTQSGGVNLYVSNYDNHPSIYIPSENKVVWAGHGVFDFVQKTWTYGNRSPNTQGWTGFMEDPLGMGGVYNPTVAWSSQLDKGVWFGGSAGGYCEGCTVLRIIERGTSGPPWKITSVDLASQGVEGFNRSRNTAVCIGQDLYLGGAKASGAGNGFYKINLATKTRTATLAPYPAVSGEYFPQMVYDSRRGHIVVLGIRVFDYDVAANTWSDVTPAGWPGYTNPMGVYHPALDAIFFRGMPKNSSALSDMLKWHRMSFSGGSGSVSPPPPPTDTIAPTVSISSPLPGASVSGTVVISATSSDNVGVVGVQFKLDGNNVGLEDTSSPHSVSWNTTTASSGSHTLTAVARDAAGNQTTSPTVIVTLTGTPSTASRYRQININSAANPFKGPPDAAYGGSKHVWWVWHPVKKRVYTWGGDYGVGANSFGQPDMGSNFTTNDPATPRTFARDSSLNNDQYSIDPYSGSPVSWRLEHPYIPRNMGGTREVKPGRPDQSALVWDSARSKLWGIITVLRTEFLYYVGGVPDLWANGDMTTVSPFEPIGTYSWVPGASGSPGAWTLETSARVAVRSGGTSYSGNVLITGSADERIANWEYDPATDRIVSFGVGRLFIFNPGTKTYEHRAFSPPGFGYFNPCSSYVAIVGNWMYGVALTNQSGTRKSQLIRVNIPNMLALANGAAIPDNSTYWEAIQLPWSLSPGSVWENSNDASSKWQEHAGVMSIDGKVVIVKSYDGLVEDGVTKMTIWDPGTRIFTPADPAPENIAANSWVALPDSGEVLFGLNTMGYTNSKLWAYKVSTPPSTGTAPLPPSNLQIQ
jgi:Bacterial Ig domain